MLPHIHPKDRRLPHANNRILIFRRHNRQPRHLPIFNLDQPTPPASLDAQQRRIELLLELLLPTPRLLNQLAQLGRRLELSLAAVGRREVLPEEGVIDVAAAVEADSGLELDLGRDVRGRGGGVDGLEGFVEVGYVGLVVLGVVEFHNLLGYGGLEGLGGCQHSTSCGAGSLRGKGGLTS